MNELTIYGASDDLIEIDGDIREEFNAYLDDESVILAVSDGSLLRVRYDEDGIWRITPIFVGPETEVSVDSGRDDRRHSDLVTLTGGNYAWVVLGSQLAK